MVLTIPQAGLHLELPSSSSATTLPTQAFTITLNNSVIEDLIDCVQNGQDIKLCLGNNPTFLYGSSTHKIQRTADSSPYDLFLTDPRDDSRRATKLPGPAMSLFKKPDLNKMPWLKKAKASEVSKPSKLKAPAPAAPKKTGLDADIEALENSFAAHAAERLENSVKVIEAFSHKGGVVKIKKKLLPASKGAISSLPSSPALTGLGSASPSQQLLDKAKQARSPIIHELAFRDQTYDNLWNKYPGSSEAEFKVALDKVADLDKESQNYILRPKYWKELDVFNHEYASDEERQVAIDNAVKAYDRQRISSSDWVWQLLLPENERGKGKCLSKLVKLSQGPALTVAAPKIKLQKADESGPESGSSNDRAGGEPMSRSSSQTKPKKPTAREAQEKRMLGGGGKKAGTPKISPTKPAPKPAVNGAAKSNINSKYKSAEYVLNSDSDASDSSAPLANSKAVKKPVAKPAAERLPSKPLAKKEVSPAPAAKPKPRPAVKKEKPVPAKREEVIKAQITAKPVPRKRPREDDDSSSSSGTPLSKRHKLKEPPGLVSKAASSTLKHRSPDSITSPSLTKDNLRGVNGREEYRPPKSTSPTKSSPLASSPPTNASDLDPAEENAHISTASKTVNGTKRKLGGDDHESSNAKRQRLSQDVVLKAMKFRTFYDKYEALHNEMVLLDNPPESKVHDLKEMRKRLEILKDEIYREAA